MAIDTKLPKYIHQFSHLRTDRTGKWTESTRFQAPHKPFLLLVVIDLFTQGWITSNLIEITPELGELFASYWSKILPERRGNLALPFFHLRSSGFWHLCPKPGQEGSLENIRQVDSLSHLKSLFLGASLNDDLYSLLQISECRNTLKTVLVQTYFAPEYRPVLLTESEINLKSFLYSQHLIETARKQLKETSKYEEDQQPVVRDQGFRRAIIRIYEHRCAFCGVRMLTTDGHSVVDAAHIIPWTVSHNDDPHNGIALCRLCHWTFDEGMVCVTQHYQMKLSRELRSSLNVSGHLSTLEGRILIGPDERELWPDIDSLGWHKQNIYRE